MDIKFIIYIVTGILIILLSSITLIKLTRDKQNIFSRNVFIAILVITICALSYYLITRNQQKECEECEKCEESIFKNVPPEQTKRTIKELMEFIAKKQIKASGPTWSSQYEWLNQCMTDDNYIDLLYHTCPYYKLTLEQLNKDLLAQKRGDEVNPTEMPYLAEWTTLITGICVNNRTKYT